MRNIIIDNVHLRYKKLYRIIHSIKKEKTDEQIIDERCYLFLSRVRFPSASKASAKSKAKEQISDQRI